MLGRRLEEGSALTDSCTSSGSAPMPPRPFPASVDGLMTELVRRPDEKQRTTFVHTVDPRTALARGLKEYIEPISVIAEGGRQLRFEQVQHTWSEPEVPGKFPACSIVSIGDGEYDTDAYSWPEMVADGSGRFVRKTSELVQEFQVVVWTTDPVARYGFVSELETRFSPFDWMLGFRLRLPFYYGMHCDYKAGSVVYDDQATDAQRRWRRAMITVMGHCSVLVPVGDLPRMDPRLELDVDGIREG